MKPEIGHSIECFYKGYIVGGISSGPFMSIYFKGVSNNNLT